MGEVGGTSCSQGNGADGMTVGEGDGQGLLGEVLYALNNSGRGGVEFTSRVLDSRQCGLLCGGWAGSSFV